MSIEDRSFAIWARQSGKPNIKYSVMNWLFSYMLDHPEDFKIRINNKKLLKECIEEFLTYLDQQQIIEPLK